MESNQTVDAFLRETTLHGVKFLGSSNGRKQRYIWAVLLVGVWILSFYFVTSTVMRFFKYESFVISEVVLKDALDLPALTVCNLNSGNRSLLREKFPSLLEIEEALQNPEFVANITKNPDLLLPLKAFSNSIMTEIYLTAEETFVQCRKGAHRYMNCSDIATAISSSRGGCFTINGNKAVTTLKAFGPGLPQGYTITLDANIGQKSLWPIMPGSGFLVMIHPRNEFPSFDKDAFFVGPGTATVMKLQKVEKTALDQPYSKQHCISDKAELQQLQKSSFPQHYTVSYSQAVCLEECYVEQILFGNSCTYFTTNGTECTFYDYYTSGFINYGMFLNGELSISNICSHCYPKCKMISYNVQVSQSVFPSQQAMDDLHRLRPNYNETELEKNLLDVTVYYETLEELHLIQVAAMPGSALFSNIGGSLGLCVGASIITFLEFLDCLIQIIRQKKQKTECLQD